MPNRIFNHVTAQLSHMGNNNMSDIKELIAAAQETLDGLQAKAQETLELARRATEEARVAEAALDLPQRKLSALMMDQADALLAEGKLAEAEEIALHGTDCLRGHMPFKGEGRVRALLMLAELYVIQNQDQAQRLAFAGIHCLDDITISEDVRLDRNLLKAKLWEVMADACTLVSNGELKMKRYAVAESCAQKLPDGEERKAALARLHSKMAKIQPLVPVVPHGITQPDQSQPR